MQACDVLAAELMHEPVVDVDCLTLLLELRLSGLLTLLFELFESFELVDDVAETLTGVRREALDVPLPLSTLCWRLDVFRMFEPSFDPVCSLLAKCEFVEYFCRLFGVGV